MNIHIILNLLYCGSGSNFIKTFRSVVILLEKRKWGAVNSSDLVDLIDLPVVVSAKRRNIVEPDNENGVSRLFEIIGFNEFNEELLGNMKTSFLRYSETYYWLN